ncbi:hypothetical protein Tco_0907613 [Tanacetum coccineum]|uniref:Uncharacterized protein n=1 Tax=Tanacetum coccineum TaxID=301880 RepID=A0ABQ5CKM8_9ASTR
MGAEVPKDPGVEVEIGKIGVEAPHRAIVIMMMKAIRKRWWKSIITVAKPPENEVLDVLKKDEPKDEIVYDYDDYPTSKSNDSNELVDRSNVPPEKCVIELDSAPGNVVSEVKDLESILRQKAFEDLSNFRGGPQTKPVVPVNNEQPTSAVVSMSPVSQPVMNIK